MVAFLHAIHECFCGADYHQVDTAAEEQVIASDVLRTLFRANQGRDGLRKSMQDIVGQQGWKENIAKAVLRGIEDALTQGAQVGTVMKEASEKAVQAAIGFARDHPYFCALIAIGVLAILMPWALEALGFTELGPAEGRSGLSLSKLRS